ncbi:MAG: endonuclease/exonuclease/phosphatase family protein [Candidatus Saccharibacteria bacterium]|nr:endonuclease/exonuclease/phosphatase family protein [Candidatus Saccharibacteria bacterium]
MKIISLNLARKDDLGEDYDARIKRIAKFLDQERADIVCFQEVSFSGTQSLADDINQLMSRPYKNIWSILSRKCKISNIAPAKRATSMKKLYAKDKNAIFTDGEAIMSNFPSTKQAVNHLHKVPTDERGRRDPHPRIIQNIDFDTLKISNVHFAANNNAHFQLEETLGKIKHDRVIVGDFNMTSAQIEQYRNLWQNDYHEASETYKYISFPADGVAYDHVLIPKQLKLKSLKTQDNLSDHSAVIIELMNL